MISLNNVKRLVGVASVVALLGGCVTGWKVDQVKDAQASGTPFTKALHKEYVELVKGEENQEDWHSADYFARKGLEAASGTTVMPEEPAQWGVSGDSIEAVSSLRSKLVSLLDARGRQYRPEIAARGQVSFDCLVEQLAEGEAHQPMHIKHCRDGLLAAIAALEAPMQKNFVILFGFNKSHLNKEAKRQVAQISKEAGMYPQWFVHLEGHTDTVGSQKYNMGLSMRRSASVRRGLIRSGVQNQRIYVSGHGELRLAVPTPDNTKEQRNRRVEVTLTEQR